MKNMNKLETEKEIQSWLKKKDSFSLMIYFIPIKKKFSTCSW